MNGVHFLHADKHLSFYKLALSFLVEVARHVQSNRNRKLVIFLQHLKKKVLQLPLFSIVIQNIHNYILRGSSHVCCYLLLFLIFLRVQVWENVLKINFSVNTLAWSCRSAYFWIKKAFIVKGSFEVTLIRNIWKTWNKFRRFLKFFSPNLVVDKREC